MINTLFTGKHLVHLAETPSTNTYAKAYISNSSPIDGTVILADKQTAGRGQAGNNWVAEPGQNLTFSIVYFVNFLPAARQFALSQAVALGLRSAVAELLPGVDCRIKWPNDILAAGKKIAGILIENTIQGEYLKYAIAGIGLNVNQRSFPPDLPHAGSLSGTGGKEFRKEAVLEIVLQHIEGSFLQLRNGNAKQLKENYLSHLYGLQELRQFADENGEFTGRITGIDDAGRLLVQKNNAVMAYGFRELRHL